MRGNKRRKRRQLSCRLITDVREPSKICAFKEQVKNRNRPCRDHAGHDEHREHSQIVSKDRAEDNKARGTAPSLLVQELRMQPAVEIPSWVSHVSPPPQAA